MTTDMTTSDARVGLPLLGQWALVTGASKGIGLAVAEEFVAGGCNVVLVARDDVVLQGAADRLRGQAATANQQVTTIRADTSDRQSIEELFGDIGARGVSLDILVANAGAGNVTPFLDLPLEEWDRTLALNLSGTFQCVQSAARLMAETVEAGRRSSGTTEPSNKAILVVSSIRAVGVRPGRVAYSVTKAAVNQLVRSAAYELAPLGIRVNALSPGITATPLAMEGNPDVFSEMVATVPMGRPGAPSDMGAAALYLCSPQSRFVTGANLVVDGGESLW
jgi:3-oxoacyl-[acyl-carrier protein] reductase